MHPDHKLPSLHSIQFPAASQCHESGKANSEDLRVGDLALPPISRSTWESSFHTPLDGTEDLTLFAGSQVSWSRQYESRFDPTPLCLPCGGMGEEKMPISTVPHQLWQLRELTPG